ncbi:hypothetical protein D3C87_1280670 [compost metagenome]
MIDTLEIDDGRTAGREHQEQVLAGGRVREVELRVLADADEDLVRQVDRIVGIGRVGVRHRFILDRPDLGAVHRAAGLFQVGGEHDGIEGGLSVDDVVVGRVGVQEDVFAVGGVEAAVQAVERRAVRVREGHVGDRARHAEREGVGAGIGPVVATQRRVDGGADALGRQAGAEGGGQRTCGDVIVVTVAGSSGSSGKVLQIGGFIQGDGRAGRQVERSHGNSLVEKMRRLESVLPIDLHALAINHVHISAERNAEPPGCALSIG